MGVIVRARSGRHLWARILAALASASVLLVTGYGWHAYHSLSAGLTRSGAIDGPAGGALFSAGAAEPGSGSMNILVMGLDSRLDQDGNPLPRAVLDQLHAGDSSNGGYNTNVLMLLHVPAQGGGRVSVISIPRDDYVELPGRPDGVSKEKIKQGYGLSKDAAERRLRAEGVTDREELERQGREAGRRQTIRTVENLLGLHVDHFVEVTLVGFYDLAQALGSIRVCLLGPTQDSYSGARFSRGFQSLDAAEALAFVRQRRDYVHPDLNFTDLDRERRQQAFIASAVYQLESAGTFTHPSRLNALIDVAQRDVVIDSGLDPLAMASRMPEMLSGGNVSMTTLPVRAFSKVNGEDVNLVDTQQIRAAVDASIGQDDSASQVQPPSALPPATVDVVNASGRDGLAASLLTALSQRGVTPGRARTQRKLSALSVVRYSPDTADTAAALQRLLGGQVEAHLDRSVPAGHAVLLVGRDFTPPPDLDTGTSPTPGDSGSATPEGGGPAPTAGVAANTIHIDGIPCVK